MAAPIRAVRPVAIIFLLLLVDPKRKETEKGKNVYDLDQILWIQFNREAEPCENAIGKAAQPDLVIMGIEPR